MVGLCLGCASIGWDLATHFLRSNLQEVRGLGNEIKSNTSLEMSYWTLNVVLGEGVLDSAYHAPVGIEGTASESSLESHLRIDCMCVLHHSHKVNLERALHTCFVCN